MDIQIFGVWMVPLIVGLVELAKWFGLPTRLCPLLSITLGIAAGWGLAYPTEPVQGILVGLALGLSASGLYSGSKHLAEHYRRPKNPNKK
ncbi:hypothetical protein [Desmospora profundinema]|uniref:Holin n=1 Tax=Desmospora profundinema TaxID=1571184 RepID=A0ABU1IH82_9BACL|nr:hypothetical protein [Desmospora profundinema]MDR6224130.1 hypothetical protein [Desmospora profundinema]